MRTPEAISLLAQLLLIGFADPLQNLAHAVQVSDLSAHLGKLIGMEGNLAGLGAGIIHIQDPLAMALAASAGGTGDSGGMKRMPFEQRAAEQVVEGRELSDELASLPYIGLLSHLYRCYTNIHKLVNTFLAKHVLARIAASQ
jgi:hypothetical protein